MTEFNIFWEQDVKLLVSKFSFCLDFSEPHDTEVCIFAHVYVSIMSMKYTQEKNIPFKISIIDMQSWKWGQLNSLMKFMLKIKRTSILA